MDSDGGTARRSLYAGVIWLQNAIGRRRIAGINRAYGSDPARF